SQRRDRLAPGRQPAPGQQQDDRDDQRDGEGPGDRFARILHSLDWKSGQCDQAEGDEWGNATNGPLALEWTGGVPVSFSFAQQPAAVRSTGHRPFRPQSALAASPVFEQSCSAARPAEIWALLDAEPVEQRLVTAPALAHLDLQLEMDPAAELE